MAKNGKCHRTRPRRNGHEKRWHFFLVGKMIEELTEMQVTLEDGPYTKHKSIRRKTTQEVRKFRNMRAATIVQRIVSVRMNPWTLSHASGTPERPLKRTWGKEIASATPICSKCAALGPPKENRYKETKEADQ